MLRHHPLVRRNRLRFLGRVGRWQVANRILRQPVALAFAGGSRLLARRGDTGLTVNYYAGIYEYEDMLFVTHALREHDLFVDVGANGGAYTVLAAGVAGARALALEPVPATFELLLDNVHLNRLAARVEARNVGVGRTEGSLRLSTGSAAENRVLVPGDPTEGLEVPVRPLDVLIPEAVPEGVKGALILKVDVEGWESEVIAGGLHTLSTARPCALVIEMNGSGAHYGFDEDALHRQILDLGFSLAAYDPDARALRGVTAATGFNRVYVSDLAFFQARVSEAPPVEVWGERI